VKRDFATGATHHGWVGCRRIEKLASTEGATNLGEVADVFGGIGVEDHEIRREARLDSSMIGRFTPAFCGRGRERRQISRGVRPDFAISVYSSVGS
jgi:hypothetical protein